MHFYFKIWNKFWDYVLMLRLMFTHVQVAMLNPEPLVLFNMVKYAYIEGKINRNFRIANCKLKYR